MADQKTYPIDAAGKSMGRVAAEAAKVLMGKMSASYTPNIRSNVRVEISNVSKIRLSEKKRRQKKYTSYSGYPGGIKEESLGNLIERRGVEEALRRAVRGMLPRNTMLTARMKHLIITK